MRVKTHLTELDLTFKTNASGQALLDQVGKALGIEETWWFGLLFKYAQSLFSQYLNTNRSKNYEIEWLNLSKRVTNQVAWIEPIELELSIRFYPQNYDELISGNNHKL